jgi:nucleotide-binding universal stress UspA family protein
MFKHILIPTDGSERSDKALRHGVALAAATSARLTILTVSRPLHSLVGDPVSVGALPEEARAFVHDYMTGDAEACLNAARAIADNAGVTSETVRAEHEHVHQAIIEAANERGCDLILMASHGRSGLSAVVLGSETVKVLTHSKIPVLVYR